MRVRGLKRSRGHRLCELGVVAPYAGAWIETRPCGPCRKRRGSHPMRVRGLKLGWKSPVAPPSTTVAPYAGAWIETGR